MFIEYYHTSEQAYIFIAVENWLIILLRATSLTADFTQQLWHISRESALSILLNSVLTRSQLSTAKLGFKPTTLLLDI